MKKIFYGFVFIILVLFVVVLTLPHKGKPVYRGKIAAKSFQESVEITYDNYGIPHIKAPNEIEAYRALGFVMAQDRLLQMDLIRRLSTGQLAEILGQKALETDVLFRTLSLTKNFRQRNQESRDPHIDRLMAAFVSGANAYIDLGLSPFEYLLLGTNPKAFKVEDAHAVLGYMAYSFAMGLKADLFTERMANKLKPNEVNQLRAYPQKAKEKVSFQDTTWFKGHHFGEELVGLFTGSNAWALNQKRSKGGVILASDPHVRFSSPGLWYEAHLSFPGFEFYGHFVPGVPFAAMGHTKNHGWGVTISYVDDMDFIYEKVSKDNKSVVTKEGYSPIKKSQEKILVKDDKDYLLDVGWSPRGVFVDGILKKALNDKENFIPLKEKQKLAMHWGHHDLDSRPEKTLYYGLMAKSVDEFEQAMSYAGAPGLNVVYANQEENHIARYLVGTVWKREGIDSRRISHGEYLPENPNLTWKKVAFKDRAHQINPDSGVVVSANQVPENVIPSQFPGYFHPSDRYKTIHHLLSAQEKWNLDDMKLVQTAPTNWIREQRHIHMVKWTRDHFQDQLSPWEKKVLNWFREWNRLSYHEMGQPLVYFKVLHHFRKKAFKEMEELEYLHFCSLNDFSFALNRKFNQEGSSLLVAQSVRDALKELKANYGDDFKKWQWGSEHLITFPHPLGKASPVLASIFNHGPYPIDGGFHEINHMREVGCEYGMKVEAGPSTRRLVDFKNPKESWGILPMGNSGHRKSPFLFDQWALFKENQYRPQLMRELRKEERYGTLIIEAQK